MKNRLSIMLLLSFWIPLFAGKPKKTVDGGLNGYRVSQERRLEVIEEKVREFEKKIVAREKLLEGLEVGGWSTGVRVVKDIAPTFRYDALELAASNFLIVVEAEKSEENYKDILLQVREVLVDIGIYKLWRERAKRVQSHISESALEKIHKVAFTAFKATMNRKLHDHLAIIRKK